MKPPQAQRCSVCGGIGHKSRTCSVVQQQQALLQQQQQQMQHVAGVQTQMHQTSGGVPVMQVPMYAAVPAMPQVQAMVPQAAAPPPMATAMPIAAPAMQMMAAAPPPMAPPPMAVASPEESPSPPLQSDEAKPEPLAEPQGAQ